MLKTGVFLNLLKLKHGGKDKIARARSIQARLRAHTVYFDKQGEWYPAFEDECSKFPRDTHDDQVDCFAYLGMLLNQLIEAPTREEQDEDEYLDELYASGNGDSGRSQFTGY
jgi:phage terminase large subunit-like protein